jgi:3-phenylpropionate/trans-cinnamate dioxygenase ferredoxin reductase component
MTKQTFVIVGASLAGAKAAESLRTEGFDGRIALIGEEPSLPYERPPLSKDFLRDETDRAGTLVHDEAFYADKEIELLSSTRAEEIDTEAREVVLAGGERLRFDSLLLTTGAAVRRLPVAGAELDGVRYLRSVEDSEALRERLQPGSRLAVVGAGWIGAEVAASARQRGAEVTLIDPMAMPLQRVLGEAVGRVYRDLHADNGVELRLGDGVEAFEGAGKVERVRTSSGEAIEANTVVVGIGVTPRTELAERAGLETDNGIVVDGRLETNVPGVFAAGDVANHRHPLFGALRVEHWANALNQGTAAGKAMLGADEPYARVPYFFSDQYDVGMEYSGYASADDEVILRGDPAGREFIAFWLRDERVVAGMNVNVWDVTDPIQALVRGGAVIDRQALADPDCPLDELTVAG